MTLPAVSGSQRRGPSKKAQAAVKVEDEDMSAGPSTSQPAPSSQQADMDTVAAVLTAGVDLTEEADDAAIPLVDRLAGKTCLADECRLFRSRVLVLL